MPVLGDRLALAAGAGAGVGVVSWLRTWWRRVAGVDAGCRCWFWAQVVWIGCRRRVLVRAVVLALGAVSCLSAWWRQCTWWKQLGAVSWRGVW